MANYLDANPDDALMIACHQQYGQMVPFVRDGKLQAFINTQLVRREPLADPMSPSDYVLGLGGVDKGGSPMTY